MDGPVVIANAHPFKEQLRWPVYLEQGVASPQSVYSLNRENTTEQYLIINGECSHLHGHGHDVHSAVDEAWFKLFIQIHKLLLSVGKTKGRRRREKKQW